MPGWPTEDMTLNEYQDAALRTLGGVQRRSRDHFLLAALGIGGESGEVEDEIKKVFFHDRALDREKLKKEAGDVLWYLACLAEALGCGLEDIARTNLKKLKERYPEGFSAQASAERRDVKECSCGFAEGDVLASYAGLHHSPKCPLYGVVG